MTFIDNIRCDHIYKGSKVPEEPKLPWTALQRCGWGLMGHMNGSGEEEFLGHYTGLPVWSSCGLLRGIPWVGCPRRPYAPI